MTTWTIKLTYENFTKEHVEPTDNVPTIVKRALARPHLLKIEIGKKED